MDIHRCYDVGYTECNIQKAHGDVDHGLLLNRHCNGEIKPVVQFGHGLLYYATKLNQSQGSGVGYPASHSLYIGDDEPKRQRANELAVQAATVDPLRLTIEALKAALDADKQRLNELRQERDQWHRLALMPRGLLSWFRRSA